jgi:hypothetical protein
LGIGGEQFAYETRLLQPSGHRRSALAASRRPAGFADEHRQGRKDCLQARVDRRHMGDRLVQGHRVVLPVGQHMGGDDIDVVAQHVGMAQPEGPNVGIGDRYGGRVLGPCEQRDQRSRRLLAAQQHLVADHQQVDHVGVVVGERQCPLQLRRVPRRVAIDPRPQHHPHAQLSGDRRHRIESVVDAIGAYATGHFAQLSQIGFDLRPLDVQCRVGRGVAGSTERGIRQAGHAQVAGIGQRHRPALQNGPGEQHQDAEREPRHGGHLTPGRGGLS